jgi:hypothetical protein
MRAKSSREQLRKVLVSLDLAGLVRPCNFPAWVGKRAVLVVELIDEFVMVQPVHDTRSWELVALDLVHVVPDEVIHWHSNCASNRDAAATARRTGRR